MHALPESELLQKHRKCGGSEGKTKSRMATNKDTVASVTNLQRKTHKENILYIITSVTYISLTYDRLKLLVG